MKNYIAVILVALSLFSSCVNSQANNDKTNLSAQEFADKMKELPNAPILDVRTPEEFSKGHLKNALNYDWYNDNFDKLISTLNKKEPVLVYCLSGGRSGSAAKKMRTIGFEKVYELDGGIMKWRSANLPETTEASAPKSTGMTKEQFNALLNTDKLVLIDFYADWCAPCKKMKPYLEEISKEMSSKVVVVRINADDNQTLCKQMKVDALPVLQLYKKSKMVWTKTGFINKQDVVKQLSKF